MITGSHCVFIVAFGGPQFHRRADRAPDYRGAAAIHPRCPLVLPRPLAPFWLPFDVRAALDRQGGQSALRTIARELRGHVDPHANGEARRRQGFRATGQQSPPSEANAGEPGASLRLSGLAPGCYCCCGACLLERAHTLDTFAICTGGME